MSDSPIRPATVATGISLTIAMISASNSSVKPERSRAHGTATKRTLCSGQRHPGNPGGQARLMLEEVQMPPRLLLGVVRLERRPVALRAAERRTTRKIDPQIQPLGLRIELDARDLPRIAQPERSLEEKKILRLHPTAPIIDDQKPRRQSTSPDATHPQRG